MKVLGWSGMVAVCVAALAGCSDSPTSIVATQMELSRAERLWEQSDVDDYDMTVQVTGAWFGGTVNVRVRNGVPVSVEPVDGGPELIANIYDEYDTVEELFAIVKDAAADGADHIDAQFDAHLGVPVEVYIDHYTNGADDEHGFILHRFDIQ